VSGFVLRLPVILDTIRYWLPVGIYRWLVSQNSIPPAKMPLFWQKILSAFKKRGFVPKSPVHWNFFKIKFIVLSVTFGYLTFDEPLVVLGLRVMLVLVICKL